MTTEKITFTLYGETAEFDLIYTSKNGHKVVGERHPSKPLCKISESYDGKLPKMIDGRFANEFTDKELKFQFTCSTWLRIESEVNEAAELVINYVRSFE